MITSGFGFKFLNRTGKKAIKMPGDVSLGEIEAELQAKDGPPVVIGVPNTSHLRCGEGIRTKGIVGAEPGKPKVTVEYFDGIFGRSGAVRMMLDYEKMDYTYIGHTFEEWGALKQAMNGQEYFGLPRTTINGLEYG